MANTNRLPTYYFIIHAVLITYGWCLTIYFITNSFIDPAILRPLNIFNILLTVGVIIWNLIFAAIVLKNNFGYPKREQIMPFYYLTLNLLNAFNIYYHFLASEPIQLGISVLTKSFESVIIGMILYDRFKK